MVRPPRAAFFRMHLLYLDESGSVGDPNQRHFVLAGVAVFERATHWVEQDLDNIASQFQHTFGDTMELHGSPMRSGRGEWKGVDRAARALAYLNALRVGIASRYPKSVRLFGVVINKSALIGTDPVEHAFEQISSRFDLFLKRLYAKHNDAQRGLMLFDKATTEMRIQTLAREFKCRGHTWGLTRNYAEVPVFLDSKASRLIQLADLAAFALYRYYEHADSAGYDVIKDCFDSEGGTVHGLYTRL